MRRTLVVVLVLFSCAHGPRAIQPERWHELETEHFLIRTDLAPGEARRVAVDLEEVRDALLAASWHRREIPGGKTQVIVLADDRELEEYAMKGLQGFVAANAFGEPIMVISGSDPKDQRFLKHELAHVVTNQFLVRSPRWVAEGLACYLETLRFDRGRAQAYVGEWSGDRVLFLRDEPVSSYWNIIHTGHEAEHMSAREGWAFETGAWALVRWLIDNRLAAFEDMLQRLARGEDAGYALGADFPDLTEASMKAGVAAYLRAGKAKVVIAEAPPWAGTVGERRLAEGEVYATLADLQRLSPGYRRTPERDARKAALLAQALQADSGNPLAIQLSETGDVAVATRLHPDDWRAWLVYAEKHEHDLTAMQQAVRLAPDNPTVLSRLAWAEGGQGKLDDALKHAIRAVDLAPGRSDLLAILGGVQAGSGQCSKGLESVQRAIDVLPDGAPPDAFTALKQTRVQIEEHCQKVAAAKSLEQRYLGKPHGCDPGGLRLGKRDRAKGRLRAEFLVRKDGTVADVMVKDEVSASATAAVKRYLESCKYDPVLQNGKPVEVRWQVEFETAH
jgi:tetratricopeptide (TPR) repeat protein